MPRPLRIHVANAFYHATLRGNHRQDIFRVDGDRYLLNAIVADAIERYGARIHAYCWMSNHLHFLVQVGAEPLGSVMRQIASNYARAFQQTLATTGHLFERRYYARLVAADHYLLQVIRYVHLNPVKAGITTSAVYPWSSHNAYAGRSQVSWLTTDFSLAMFSDEPRAARAAYLQFMADADLEWSPDADEVRESGKGVAKPINLSRDEWRPAKAATETLGDLVRQACELYGLQPADLQSVSREPMLVRARGWVARAAIERRVATLSEVSRALGRDRATLRYAMGLAESAE